MYGFSVEIEIEKSYWSTSKPIQVPCIQRLNEAKRKPAMLEKIRKQTLEWNPAFFLKEHTSSFCCCCGKNIKKLCMLRIANGREFFFFLFNIIYFSIPWFSHRYNIKVSREFWRKATWIQINLLQSQKQAKFFFLTFSFFSCFALYFFVSIVSKRKKKASTELRRNYHWTQNYLRMTVNVAEKNW